MLPELCLLLFCCLATVLHEATSVQHHSSKQGKDYKWDLLGCKTMKFKYVILEEHTALVKVEDLRKQVASFLLGLLLHREGGCDVFFQNVGCL
jgi:hypothetical protein